MERYIGGIIRMAVNLTYVYFNTIDYSGTSILSSYTLDITPLTFVPDFTTSSLLSGTTLLSNKKVKWDFGDGSQSNELSAVHIYSWPGQYTVKLTIFDNNGNAYDSSYQPTINIYDFVCDNIQFEDNGTFIYDIPASQITNPITLNRQNSWQSFPGVSATGYTLGLYASGASGDYEDINDFYQDKWAHLRSLSRFYVEETLGATTQYVLVDTLTTTTSEVFAGILNNQIQVVDQSFNGSEFAGTTGSSTFYYVDDRTKNFTSREDPIFIFASPNTATFPDSFAEKNNIFKYINYPPAGIQNIRPAVLPIVKVRHNPADHLSITTNGIDGEGYLSSTSFNIPQISWQNTEIPFVIKFKDSLNYTTKTYPCLSSSTINTSISAVTAYNVQFGLISAGQTSIIPITSVQFYEDFSVDAPQSLSAFYKGYFIPSTSTNNVQLTAQVNVIDPVNFPKDSLIGWISQPNYGYITRFFKQEVYNSCTGTVTVDLSSQQSFFETDPNRNIYAICVAPSGAGIGNDYQTWVADGTSDTLIKIDVYGNTLSAFELSAYPLSGGGIVNLQSAILSSAAPASIAMDGNSDVWITLFDGVSSIKIDGVSGYIKASALPSYSNLCYFLSSDYNIAQLSGFAGENTILPSSIDTDLDNNIWICYTHPLSNFLMQYDTNGAPLCVIPFPSLIAPSELIVDRNQFVWVTAIDNSNTSMTLTGENDRVYKFTGTGTLVNGYPLTGFRRVGNITVDGDQNAWVVQDRETLTRIDAISATMTNYTAGSGLNQTDYINSIGGITCDTSNYIWVINNFDTAMYFIDAMSVSQPISAVDALPLTTAPLLQTDVLSTFQERSFDAYGDWIGFRWINKYMIPYTITRTITGISNTFNINPYLGNYNITKVNEDFDANGYYDSLRFQEVLIDKDIFFDQFLGTIVGNISAQPFELGKTIYEKIANFVSNRTDVDKCNLDGLLSLCEELSIQFEQYNYPFPPELRRLIDILTIKHKVLWGEQNKFNQNFDTKGALTNSLYGINLGSQYNIQTDSISANYPVVAYELFSGIYSLVNSTGMNNVSAIVVPLSSYNINWGWGLVAPTSVSGIEIANYYNFYNYIPTFDNTFYDNIINWADPMNTLVPTVSGYNDWQEDNGIMQNMISYSLTKGLRLFQDSPDIVYNSISGAS